MELCKVIYDGTPRTVNARTRASIRYAIAARRSAYFTVSRGNSFATFKFVAIRCSGRSIEICRMHGDCFEKLPRGCEINWFSAALSPLFSKSERQLLTDQVAGLTANRINNLQTEGVA